MTTFVRFARSSTPCYRVLTRGAPDALPRPSWTPPPALQPPVANLVCLQRRYASNDRKPPNARPGAPGERRSKPFDRSFKAFKPPKTGKPARGLEYLYRSKALSTRPPAPPPKEATTQEATTKGATAKDAPRQMLRQGWEPLTNQAEKQLLEYIRRIKAMGLERQAEQLAENVEQARRLGLPPGATQLLKEIEAGGGKLTLLHSYRMFRLFHFALSSYAQSELDEAQRKKSGNAPSQPGPGKQQYGQSNKSSQNAKKDNMIPNNVGFWILAALMIYLTNDFPENANNEITWQEFRSSFLDRGLVDKLVVVNGSRVRVYLHQDLIAQQHPDSPAARRGFNYYFTIGSVEAFERQMEMAQVEMGIPSSERIPVSYSTSASWAQTLVSWLPLIVSFGLLFWLNRRATGGGGGGGAGGIFGMMKSRAKRFNHETDVRVRFNDVAGMDEAKTEIMEFVSFLKEPEKFQRLGAKIPRGAILSGPPGTGKTLLAKATAGESQVPFFSVSGSEFIEMFVGVGPGRVRDLFATARKSAPCIIFIDEIDAIGKSRGKGFAGGGNDERESTLNQILTEMDGFNTSEQVVVLAGTNRPDVLDSALTRPGRFDRHITIDRPTMEGRKQIFGVHLAKILTDEDMTYLKGRLAALTPGFSGADIANCCNEAALIAARQKAEKVRMTHFEQAIERTIGGLEKKSLVLSPQEKRTVAYHEAGHAICGWFLKWADPLLKVSIIPRGQGALGYAQYLPATEGYLMSVSQLMDRMAMTLGGRVSEELHFDSVTSGASDDFNKVTRMATAMVTKWGMSDKIGHVYFEDDEQKLQKPFSEETARHIDTEVRRLVDEAYTRCRDLLTAKKAQVGIVAEELLSKEVLSRDDMVRLVGKRPFEERGEFEKYFGGGSKKSAPPPPPTESGPQPGAAPAAKP